MACVEGLRRGQSSCWVEVVAVEEHASDGCLGGTHLNGFVQTNQWFEFYD